MWCELPYTPPASRFHSCSHQGGSWQLLPGGREVFTQASPDAARSPRACAPGKLSHVELPERSCWKWRLALGQEPATPATAFCCVAPSPTGRGPLRTPRVMEDPSVRAESAPSSPTASGESAKRLLHSKRTCLRAR